MPAQRREAKAARWAVIAGLCAIGFVVAGAPAFAASQCEPRDGELKPGAERCGGPALGPGAGRTIAGDSGAYVETPLIVPFSHHLGKREALRRVKFGLDRIIRTYSGLLFSVQEEIWTDYHLHFRVSVLGLPIAGSIDVADRRVDLEAFLPWLLAPLAEAAVPAIRKEGVRILEGK